MKTDFDHSVPPSRARAVSVEALRDAMIRVGTPAAKRAYPTRPGFDAANFEEEFGRRTRQAWRRAHPFWRRWWLAFLDRHRPIVVVPYPVHSQANFSGTDSLPFLTVDNEPEAPCAGS